MLEQVALFSEPWAAVVCARQPALPLRPVLRPRGLVALLSVEAVEPGGVAAGDLELVLRTCVLEVAGDDLLRVRPGRGLVRIVGRPHQFVDADELSALNADIVVDIGGPHLTLEILARLELVGKAGSDALAFESAVHALQVIGQPADIVLGRHDLQLREAVEHAGENQRAERLLDLVRQHGRAHIALAPIYWLSMPMPVIACRLTGILDSSADEAR